MWLLTSVLGLLLLLLNSVQCQPASEQQQQQHQQLSVSVRSDRELLAALANTSVSTILLAANITLNPEIWTFNAVALNRWVCSIQCLSRRGHDRQILLKGQDTFCCFIFEAPLGLVQCCPLCTSTSVIQTIPVCDGYPVWLVWATANPRRPRVASQCSWSKS